MRKTADDEAWVVFEMTMYKQDSRNAVCSQAEWVALERAKPGHHKLVKAGIPSEVEAELLARGTAGDDRRTASKHKWSQ